MSIRRPSTMLLSRFLSARPVTKYLPLVAMCLFACNAEGACSNDASGVYSRDMIALPVRKPDISFYFRTGHYAILIEPTAFRKNLQERSQKHGMPVDGRLLKEVVAAKVQGEYTDLFAFALKDPMFLERIELTLADMLGRGAAVIIDTDYSPNERERFVASIVLLNVGSGAYQARRFCTPKGDLVLDITDRIA